MYALLLPTPPEKDKTQENGVGAPHSQAPYVDFGAVLLVAHEQLGGGVLGRTAVRVQESVRRVLVAEAKVYKCVYCGFGGGREVDIIIYVGYMRNH